MPNAPFFIWQRFSARSIPICIENLFGVVSSHSIICVIRFQYPLLPTIAKPFLLRPKEIQRCHQSSNDKNKLSLHHGPVVQWIEFKIPVLTMKVRILSGLLKSEVSNRSFFVVCSTLCQPRKDTTFLYLIKPLPIFFCAGLSPQYITNIRIIIRLPPKLLKIVHCAYSIKKNMDAETQIIPTSIYVTKYFIWTT